MKAMLRYQVVNSGHQALGQEAPPTPAPAPAPAPGAVEQPKSGMRWVTADSKALLPTLMAVGLVSAAALATALLWKK